MSEGEVLSLRELIEKIEEKIQRLTVPQKEALRRMVKW